MPMKMRFTGAHIIISLRVRRSVWMMPSSDRRMTTETLTRFCGYQREDERARGREMRKGEMEREKGRRKG